MRDRRVKLCQRRCQDTFNYAVIVKDLRTGTEVRGDVCRATEPASSIDTGVPLANCIEPPNASVRDLWCAARGLDSPLCAAPAMDPSEPATTDPVAAEPMTSDATSATRPAATSRGCQLGQPGSATSGAAWALALAALSVAVVRRRRHCA